MSHPNTRYCPEIHVTLTEELGAVPLLSHSWMAPLVEDMLHDARTSLIEAMVTGPGRAVPFYGRHSLGEGLTLDEARDVAFLLTRVGTWIGKPAYLSADPMTIQEGQQVNAQAITDHQVKARGLGYPCANLLTQQPFRIDHPRESSMRDTPRVLVLTVSHHHTGPREAETAIDVGGTKGYHHLGYHHIPWTTGSRVIGTH